MLASKWMDPVLGVDIHVVIIPGPPGLIPVPMPFLGTVFDPAGLVMGAAIGAVVEAFGGAPGGPVKINGLRSAPCGTGVMLIPPHLFAPGTSFAPPLPKPGMDADLFFGSSSVYLEQSRAVRMGEIALSCNHPVRMPTSKTVSPPAGNPVLIGGAPVPDMTAVAMAALFAGGKWAFRRWISPSRFMRALRARLKRLIRCRNPRLRSRLRRAVCKLTGEPVDVATGRVLSSYTDAELAGQLPVKFERHYDSSLSWRDGPLGHGWTHSLDQCVWTERGKVVWKDGEGREVEFDLFDLPGRTLDVGQSFYEPEERVTLKRTAEAGWEITAADGTVSVFRALQGEGARRTELRGRLGATSYLWEQRSPGDHHRVQFGYDSNGRLVRVRGAGGRALELRYDAEGRLSALFLPVASGHGQRLHRRYTYDAAGDLVAVHDGQHRASHFKYVAHLKVQKTDRIGLSFYYQYDGATAAAKCVRTWGDGGIFDHEIDYLPQRTIVRDSCAKARLYDLDAFGMVVAETAPDMGVTRIEYDERTGQKSTEIGPLGRTTRTEYDERGNATRLASPDGSVVEIAYDEHDLPTVVTTPNGGIHRFAYDAHRNLVSETDPAGARTLYNYRDGLLTELTLPGRGRSTLDYDDAGNLVRLTGPKGDVTEYSTDALGRVLKVKDPRGAVTRNVWDAEGNLVEQSGPTGVVRRIAYDAEDNPTRIQDPTRDVALRYGGWHNVVERTEGGSTLRFEYDTEDRFVGVVNEAGERYRYELDACGRVENEIGFDGLTRTYRRDAAGQVTQVLLPEGKQTALSYDDGGRLIEVRHKDGAFTRFSYGPDGALLAAENAHGKVALERDALGRVHKEVSIPSDATSGEEDGSGASDASSAGDDGSAGDDRGTAWVRYEYGPSGVRTALQSSLGARQVEVHSGSGELESIHLGADPRTQWVTHIERDMAGLEIGRALPGGFSLRTKRDLLGRPLERRLEHQAPAHAPAGEGARTVLSRTYQWQGQDRLSAIVDGARGRTSFVHDARGRLIGAELPDGTEACRSMDAVGNLFRDKHGSGRRYKAGGRLIEQNGTRYEYDPLGNLTRRTLVDGAVWHYRWSDAGELIEVERPDGRLVRFAYDAFGRRTQKSVYRIDEPDNDGAPPRARGKQPTEELESTTRYLYSGHQLLHEIKTTVPGAVDSSEAEASAELTTWYHEPGTFTPLVKEHNGKRHTIVTDHIGTPTEMLDEAGHIAWQAQLDLFGVAQLDRGSPQDCPFRYPGQYEDPETGLYYNRFRYYDPQQGRYISQDPLRLDGGLELFGYVPDPNVWIDPLGLTKGSGGCVTGGEKGPSGRLGIQKFLQKRWDKATFPSVKKTVAYHVGKHGKGLSPVEYTQRALRAFGDGAATRKGTTDLLGRDAVKIASQLGSGLFTPKGKIIWFHPTL